MPSLRLRESASVARVVAGGRLGRYAAKGESVTSRFEGRVEQLFETPHALAVNSGTSALISALVAVGVGPGDEVLVPAYTWVSTAAAPLALGAVPVLVDIDESLTIDPVDLKSKITDRTRAVMPVHMLNLVCNMDAITSLASDRGIAVVEDACQAFGVRYRGRRVGTIGDVGAYSFSQTKNISSGEGGLVVTADERAAVRAGMFHDVGSYTRAGWVQTQEPLFVGMNLKMSEVTSAVLLPQLRGLDAKLARLATRRRIAVEELSRNPDITVSPHHAPDEAIGLTITFAERSEAERFADATGMRRLIETGRHVHLNWESLRGGRTYHEGFTPYAWAGHREGTVGPGVCEATLDILARSCVIPLRADLPELATRTLGRQLTAFRRPPGGLKALDLRGLRMP